LTSGQTLSRSCLTFPFSKIDKLTLHETAVLQRHVDGHRDLEEGLQVIYEFPLRSLLKPADRQHAVPSEVHPSSQQILHYHILQIPQQLPPLEA
jgi:hypothetical protein